MLVAIAPLVITLAAPAAIAQPAPSEAFQRATLEGLSPETRAKVERRATGGNSVYEVAMQLANLVKPGEPPLSSVVAIDFIRKNSVSSRFLDAQASRKLVAPRHVGSSPLLAMHRSRCGIADGSGFGPHSAESLGPGEAA